MTETIKRLRFPRLRFPVPLVTALALLAILGTLFLPGAAQAQTATVLVSNLGQAHEFGTSMDDTVYLGQGFTVATGGGNYTLTSIEIPIVDYDIAAADIDSLSVSVWSTDSSGVPDSSLHALGNPASITADTTATFDAQSGMALTLEAGKTYAVIVYYDKTLTSNYPRLSLIESLTESGVTGWTIANERLFRVGSTDNWSTLSDEVVRMRVNGTAAGGDTPTVSTDATLSALSLGTGVTLSPAFDADTYAYTASVANSVDEVTVTASTTDTDATFEYLDESDATLDDEDTNAAGHQVELDVGDTVFKVKVTAEDGTTTQNYTVTVTRAACTLNDGDLWCGVVDVGTITNSGGMTQSHGFQGTKGDLSDKTFSLMFETGTTNNYTITAIVVGARTAISEQLFFVTSNTLTNTEEESLALHVDGESDPFVWSDSTEVIPGSYRWPARTDLDWSSETTVTLRLREFLRPTVTNVAVTSMPVLETDTYGAGETIEVSVTFSEAVDATSNTDFVLSVGGARRAPLLSGSGTATLVFGYTVVSSDEDTNGIWIGDETRTLVGNRNGEAQNGTITSVATGAAAVIAHTLLGTDSDHKVDGSRSIISVEVTSMPQLESDTYGAGETIQFTVTFNVAVDVDGDPVLKFVLGNSGDTREVDAAYVSGTGAKALVFGYTVVSTDEDNNGIYLRDEQDYDDPDGPVRLDSNDEIEFKDTSTDVPLYWQGRGNHSDHKVDGSRTTGNTAPSFTSSPTFDVAENQTVVGTVLAADSDADDSVTGYAITGGADQTFFSIGATSGALTFDAAPNYEDADDSGTNNTYVVDVTATSGAGTRVMTATQTITVTVTDVDTEAPGKPGAPTVSAASATSLSVSWSAPDNAGPAITDYDVQYREGNSGGWTDGSHNGTATTATLTGLSENTSYQVQVQATNDEGTGDWSDSGSGTTDAAADAANASPSFSSSSATISVAENETTVVTVLATDSDADDDITGYAITGGPDQTFFSIGETSGALTFEAAPNHESPQDQFNNNTYVVDVTATSGTGTRVKTATQTITVTVTDVSGEAPGKPAKPRVSAASATSLRVNWSAPDNEGPPITDYDVRYRAGNSGGWSDASHTGKATTATLTGLTEDTSYQVQVRAKNAEGTGAWSDSGSGTPAEEDDLPADTTTTGVVEVNGSAVRGDIFEPKPETATWTTIDADMNEEVHEQIVYDFDTDWFAVQLEEGRTYRIDMKGAIHADDDDLTLRLPQINAIYNKDGDFLVNTFDSDESDSHYLFRVTFHAYDDGTYYIAASGESHEWGTYELTVIDITRDVGDYTNVGDDTNAQRGLKNLRAVEEKGGVRLTWQPPDGAAVTGYRIERRRAGGQDSGPQRSHGQPRDHHTLVEDTGNTETSYVDESAEQGVEYEYRVTARNESGPGESSDWVRAGPEEEPVLGDGLPGAPRNLTATPGNKEVTLSWDPPDDNGNPPATRYRIEWRVDGKDYDRNDWGTSQETTYTTNAQANLANGVKYFFRVKAENDDGNSYGPYGPSSEEVSSTPTSGSAVDLGTPVLSDTETLHHGMVQLDWQDIEDAGWYVVQYYHVEDEEWLDLPAVGVDIAFHGSSAVVTNLDYGIHWLRVGAASCAGSSEWSQIEELYGTRASDWKGVPVPEVEEGDEIEPCPVVLGTPVLSEPENLHHGMVKLDWQDIEDAGWYVVQYYHVEDGEWLDLPAEGVDIAFHGSSAVVSNLHGLSWLRVGAASCDGASEWSQIEQLFGTNASDWEGVPVPEVAEGDEIAPCSEDADTSDNSPATGAPTITGTAQVGETLTANTSGVADADGLSNVQYEYQWLADDADINGATGSTYTLTDSDEGKAAKVRVSFTDDAGNHETLTSEATDAVAAATQTNSPATGAPTISGTAQVGETLTANTSGIADADGLSNVQYEYQWLADDADISGATNATYTLIAEDEGKAIKVQVSFTDDESNEESLTSAATGAVDARPNSPATGAPTISGTAQVGETLTADTSGITDLDGMENATFTYQWLLTGQWFADDTDIAGATGLTYTLTDSEESNTVKVQVSFTDDAGNDETLTSATTGAVAGAQPTEPPAKPRNLSTTATHDSVTLTWDDPGDDSITGYVILRRVPGVDPEGQFRELVPDTGTAATTYTDDTVSAETRYTYRIKAINGAGTSERSRWSHIDVPAAPVPDKPTGLEATESHGQVVLTWDDPGDDSITGYVILRRVRENDTGGDFDVLVADTGTAALTYTDDTVAAGLTYTYRIKAINEHGTSERSRWYHIDIPAAP